MESFNNPSQESSKKLKTKYIFITGGVVSGIGKGVTASSIARLLQNYGYKVDYIKIDPYLNVDPGTLNPIEHGEVFITEDVWDFNPSENIKLKIAELDQDFGHFERFNNQTVHPRNNITSGQVYLTVILQERFGKYLGKTIQIVPHLTNEIKRRIHEIGEQDIDILLIEIGGTVGDIESAPFLEAIRQFRLEHSKFDSALIHVTILPYLHAVGQLKTKPTQHSVKELQSAGIQPDIIVGRAKTVLTTEIKDKISKYTNIPHDAVFSNPDLDEILFLPETLEKQGLFQVIQRIMNLELPSNQNQIEKRIQWENMLDRYRNAKDGLRVAVAGKYVSIQDSYISICKAITDGAVMNGYRVQLDWIDTESLETGESHVKLYEKYHGILLTPGFGERGTEGMIATATYARQHGIPLLGICFGAQLMTVAFARSVMGWTNAHTTEIDPDIEYPVVDLLASQRNIDAKGGTMRLGAFPVVLVENTHLQKSYNLTTIKERFRHRYHIIPKYAKEMEKRGLRIAAYDPTGEIVNTIEYEDHPFAIGVQFHPEFQSRPESPSPLYTAFGSAMVSRYKQVKEETKKS